MQKVKSESEVAQSCPTLRDPMDCSLPGSSVHGILQARVLEWGVIAFSEGASESPALLAEAVRRHRPGSWRDGVSGIESSQGPMCRVLGQVGSGASQAGSRRV